jgi:hypothetical protein
MLAILDMLVPWLWRISSTVLFLGGAVPLYLRAIRGVIPEGDGIPHPIDRRTQPMQYWPLMTVYLAIAVGLTVSFILSWWFPLPSTVSMSVAN